jgi:hypothetical protein
MQDFSQLLAEKVEAITQQWVDTIIQDEKIKSTDHLSRPAIKDHVSDIISALATLLNQTQESDIETIAKDSLHHGSLRAEQDFDPTEVVREYHLLRSTIVTNLRPDLLQGTPEEVLRAVSLIDAVVDTALAHCFRSYVERRLQELVQLQNQLTLTIQELKRLLRDSQDNLSLMAHELKTPLTSIIGYSDLFLRQQRSSEVKDTVPKLEHIERVLNNGRQLLRLINDALELSRHEAGKMQLKLALTDVRSAIDIVMETMQPLADKRGLKLVLNCEHAPRQVITDSFRLQQILTNLVSNAIRYTETGSVTIKCHWLTEDQWAIAVTDTGIGIAPEDQERIFDPFTRTQSDRKLHPPDSTGLGLAIVVRLVKLLQGKISLTSQVGVGSTFTVILPLEVMTQEEVMTSASQ